MARAQTELGGTDWGALCDSERGSSTGVGTLMKFAHRHTVAALNRTRRSSQPVPSAPRGRSGARFQLPLEQAAALAQFPEGGIADSELAWRLGMTSAEAAKMRETLLRRRLVQRTPPGRPLASSRLLLTGRGKAALLWLDELQASLPPTLFEVADPPLPGVGAPTAPAPVQRRVGVGPGRRIPWPLRRASQGEIAVAPAPAVGSARSSAFERGLLNVWLGTGLFAGAVLVGALMQTERAALVALGVGCCMAVVFLARAGVVLGGGGRELDRPGRNRRRHGRHRPGPRNRHRPRSGGVTS